MRPFQQFRLWTRRAPLAERGTAAVVAAVAVALVAWLLVPATGQRVTTVGGGSGGTAGSGRAAGTQGSDAAGTVDVAIAGTSGDTVRSAATDSAAGAGAGSPTTGADATGGCVSPPGSDQGVSDSEIRIAMILAEVGGPAGNATFNVPSGDAQKADYQAVIDDINDNGGVVCRKLVPLWFTVNPLDQANLQKTCLDIVQANVFYVNDLGGYGAYPALANCYPEHQLPFFEGNYLPQSMLVQGYPYMFAASSQDIEFWNAVHALHDIGWFDPANGFKKLGYLYRDCVPELATKMQDWLHQVGLDPSQIVTYDIGCPTAPVSPSDDAQAVIKFQQSGVSHVITTSAEPDWSGFTHVADAQNFHPHYALPDQAIAATVYGTSPPNWGNADGTIVVTQYRFGEEHTPGFVRTAGTERCAKIVTARGQPDPYTQQIGMSGLACNQLWFFVAAVSNAPSMQRVALASGLHSSPQIDFSFPHGPATFPTPQTTYGGNFWRMVVAHVGCRCFQVPDPDFHPPYPGFEGP